MARSTSAAQTAIRQLWAFITLLLLHENAASDTGKQPLLPHAVSLPEGESKTEGSIFLSGAMGLKSVKNKDKVEGSDYSRISAGNGSCSGFFLFIAAHRRAIITCNVSPQK